MKIIARNCRGLGNRLAVRSLLELQKTEGADVLFLSETKLDKRRMERFKWLLGLGNMVVRGCVGGGGDCSVVEEGD
jgi:exonuclease III